MAVVSGTAYWASITQPNTTFEPVWTVNLVLDDPEKLEYFRTNGFTVKPLSKDDATESVVFKRKVTNNKGEPNKQPKLVNLAKEPISVLIGNGSKVNVQYNEWEADNKYGHFKGLDLKGVQVVDLVEYGSADGDEFDNLDDDSEF